MSLGPVVRNVLKDEHAEPPKPHLSARIGEAVIEITEHGALMRQGDKLAFKPNYAGENPAPKLTRYKEPAYIPFQGDNAYLDPAPLAKQAAPAAGKILTGSVSVAKLTEELPPTDFTFQIGDRVRKVNGPVRLGEFGTVVSVRNNGADDVVVVRFDDDKTMQCWMSRFAPAEAMPAAKQDWDPKASPLRVGDRVRQVKDSFINPNKTAVVTDIGDGSSVVVKWDDPKCIQGYPWEMPRFRDCFEIIERGVKPRVEFDPRKSEFQIGDRVKKVDGAHRGSIGVVTRPYADGQMAHVRWESGTGLTQDDDGKWNVFHWRDHWEILERPAQ